MLAVETTNEFLVELINGSTYPIFSLGSTGKLLSTNPSFSQFLSDNDLLQKDVVGLVNTKTKFLTVSTGIYQLMTTKQEEGLLVSLVPIKDSKGDLILESKDAESRIYFEEGSLAFLDQGISDLLGYSDFEIKNLDKLLTLIYSRDRNRFEDFIDKVKNGEDLVNVENSFSFFSKAGDLLYLDCSIKAGINAFSKKSFLLVGLKPSDSPSSKFRYEDGFDLLLDNTNDFLIIYEDDIVKHVSNSFSNLDYAAADIKTLLDIESLVHADDIGQLRDKVVRDRAEKRTDSVYRFRIVKKNGGSLWYETTVKRTFHASGKIKSLIGFYRDITERKIAEDRIIASQEYLKKLTNAVTDALYVFDLDTFNYTFSNTSFEKTLGYSTEELRLNAPNFLSDIVHPDDRDKILGIRKALVQDKKTFYELNFRIKHKSGGYKVLSSKLYPFRFEGSTKNEVICFTEDVTNQIATQKEMSEIRTKYQLAVEASSSGTWEYEIATGGFRVDDKVKSILGYSEGESIDSLKAWEERIYPDDYRWVKKTSREYIEQKIDTMEIAYRVIHKTGVVRWILAKGKALLSDDDSKSKLIGTFTDITELKEYERALSASEENYRDLAESLSDIFLALNKNLVFTYWNKACEKIFKVPAEKAIGRKMYEVLPYFAGSDIEKAILTSLIRQKVNTTIFKRKGSDHVYEVTTYPSKTGVSLFAKNITNKIRYEEKLISSRKTAEEALKMKEEFMSVMSHEIRTPLNAIVGLTHLLLENSPKPDQIETINTLKFSGDNLLVLVNDILDFSKIQAGKIELVDSIFDLHTLAKNLKNTYEAQAKQKGVKLSMSLLNDPPRYILGDKVRLTQILNNLLNNAIKFTKEGEVSIDVEKLEDTPDKAVIKFIVSDTGIGIDEKDQGKIFDPFQQASKTTSRRFGGTGLGLSIIKNLVELQEGNVNLKSKLGEGSQFEITLPFCKSSQKAHDLEISNNEITNDYDDLQDIKLLYVDDVATNQFLMSGFCSRWNIQLDKAMNGFEALDKVREKEYDCILMDIQMPEIDGYETSKRIRAMEGAYYQGVPIIAYTAEVNGSGKLNVDEAGMDDLLTKPVDPKELFRKINKYSGKTVKENKVRSKIKDVDLSISFSDLDDLYADSADTYVEFLSHLEKEVLVGYKELTTAIKEDSFEAFVGVKHKMQTSMKLLNFSSQISYLEDIKKDFKEKEAFLNKTETLSKINQFSDYLIKKISSRKEELQSTTKVA